MVWQDFPLSCNLYPDTDDYLSLLESEATAIIHNFRDHPSLVLWCGGNELFEFHSGMTEQALPLRLLGALTYALDPHRPFIMSSPVLGVGHGPYELLHEVAGEWRDGLDLITKSSHTAYPELACPSVAPLEVLRRIIPEGELYPPRAGTAWEDHGAFNAFAGKLDSWLDQDALRIVAGSWSSLAELVSLSQGTQANVVKLLIEAARRKAPMASLSNVWVLNEPWPTATNLSLVSWGDVPKPALSAVGAANRRSLLSVELPKMVYRPGETVTLRVWLLSFDKESGRDLGAVRLALRDDADPSGPPLWQWEGELAVDSLASNLFDKRSHAFPLPPEVSRARYRIDVSCSERPDLASEYLVYVSPDI
jgi:beta-mannosidase